MSLEINGNINLNPWRLAIWRVLCKEHLGNVQKERTCDPIAWDADAMGAFQFGFDRYNALEPTRTLAQDSFEPFN